MRESGTLYYLLADHLGSTSITANGSGVKVAAGGTTTVYVRNHYEKNLTTGVVTKYYLFGGKPVALKVGTDRYWLHSDHLGSTTLVTRLDGTQEAVRHYYPWGGLRPSQAGDPHTKRLYTGQLLDESTGLYHYGARYYDTALGRFISADTIVPGPADPQSLNRFSYVRNNPLGYVDPTGHAYEEDAGGVCTTCKTTSERAADYGVTFTSDQDSYGDERDKQAALEAVETIANAYVNALVQRNREYARYGDDPVDIPDARALFNETMGPVTLNRHAGNCPDGSGCWGWANNPRVGMVQFYDDAPQGGIPSQTFAHELGHVFDARVNGYQPRGDLTAEWNANPNFPRRNDRENGFRDSGRWEQSTGLGAEEEFADMYLGWAYNTWGRNPAGEARSA